MQYKTVPVPMSFEGTPAQVAKIFEQIMNNNAVDGWRYHSTETITSYIKPGCRNLGRKEEINVLYMLIFEKNE